ncbi:hypothetical protein AJ80_00543 [Polytolypa hystricis UAMH7299]|uniref:Bud22 domain-containing protein n=1 Tax=Polytolypa hystricis (strain UAMH7299) TaxID=1447883 RepID=A0A2B7Z2B1_POLH7|nr:hypothetical protein AJ80_00543 [Polytolypa hystricis UAMH7299]
MTKRKRSDDEGKPSSNPDDRRIKIQTSRLEQRIEHGLKLLHRALKTAKGFERQKLGRRQKTATEKKDDAQLARLPEEIKVLKELNLEVTAKRHLYKQMIKTKRIAESPAFVRLAAPKDLPPLENTALANVTARLFNSNPVREVLPGIMSGIREVLGLADEAASKKQKTSKETREKEEEIISSPIAWRQLSIEAGLSGEDVSDEEELDLAQYGNRLASSSDEGSDDEEDSFPISRSATSRYDPSAELSLSPTSSVASSESIPEIKVKSKKSGQPTTSETTFLPSLMMGGYWSGSESADEDEVAAAVVGTARKNRRGQRARQQLWEKKYGTNANHVKKQQDTQKLSRDSGWDMKRGATSTDDAGGKRGKGRGAPAPARRQRNDAEKAENANIIPLGIRGSHSKPKEAKPLHPSWAAAKKVKEQAKAATFQGKKVVFD